MDWHMSELFLIPWVAVARMVSVAMKSPSLNKLHQPTSNSPTPNSRLFQGGIHVGQPGVGQNVALEHESLDMCLRESIRQVRMCTWAFIILFKTNLLTCETWRIEHPSAFWPTGIRDIRNQALMATRKHTFGQVNT